MIVQIVGNINYPITLDPTVWIFDDRKILLEEAFTLKETQDQDDTASLEKTAQQFDQEINQDILKPPVNKSINRFEREKILANSYVMPIKDFLSHAEIKSSAINATLITHDQDIKISLEQLQNCYLLFAVKGKPLKDDGPVHLYYQDGSNKDKPIKGIHKIMIN